MEIKEYLIISSRAYLSISHILAAFHFARETRQMEAQYTLETANGEIHIKHHGQVISAILLANAFIEATINELCTDCADGGASRSVIPSKNTQNLIGRMWKRGIPRTSRYGTLEKYQIALEIMGFSTIDEDRNPYQDANLLTKLRNALVHYEPETVLASASTNIPEGVEKGVGETHKFEAKFKGKFQLNSFTGPGNAFYPDKLLGAGCAAWSAKTALAFTDSFFSIVGIKPPYEHIRTKLSA